MALELTIYNRQAQTCKSGKEYIGYSSVCIRRGAIPAAAELAPFYPFTSEISGVVSSGSGWKHEHWRMPRPKRKSSSTFCRPRREALKL
jgi:hypothetical protein